MVNKYPYTDLHELNLDWILQKMKELDERLDNAIEEIKAEVIVELKQYVDDEVAELKEDFSELSNDFATLQNNFEVLSDDVINFYNTITAKMTYLEGYTQDLFNAANARTDVLIASNNEYLLSEMATYLNQIKVVNYFTGQLVTIQDMFNYLAGLHLTDSINYQTITARGYTYNSIEALNITYSDMIAHGNTLMP